MSDSASIKPGDGGGNKKLAELLSRGKNIKAAFARVYPIYQRLQTERFESKNASEGGATALWPALNPVYAKYKPKRYGGGPRRKSKKRAAGTWNSYPGKGSKIMIGTGMLAGAAIGPSDGSQFTDGISNHRAMFSDNTMTISVEESGENPDGNKFDYPHFSAEHRPFMSFGSTSIMAMQFAVSQYILEAYL